jgi:hypothetical protein
MSATKVILTRRSIEAALLNDPHLSGRFFWSGFLIAFATPGAVVSVQEFGSEALAHAASASTERTLGGGREHVSSLSSWYRFNLDSPMSTEIVSNHPQKPIGFGYPPADPRLTSPASGNGALRGLE